MTENRSEQNLAGNVSQRDGVELHKGIHWDQLMIVTPDYQEKSCDELYRQTVLAWEAASVSGEFGRNGCQAAGTARQPKIDADLVPGTSDNPTEVTPQAKIVVRHDGLCELAHIVMRETDATNALPIGKGKVNPQPLSPKPAEPDLALIYFGSLFETLRQAPESHESRSMPWRAISSWTNVRKRSSGWPFGRTPRNGFVVICGRQTSKTYRLPIKPFAFWSIVPCVWDALRPAVEFEVSRLL